jgi:hypothetical protein
VAEAPAAPDGAKAELPPDVTPAAPAEAAAEPSEGPPAVDGPTIEAMEIDVGNAERLKAVLEAPPPPSSPPVGNIPRPRGRAPRMVALTLLDGTTISLPAKRRARERPAAATFEAPAEARGETLAERAAARTSEPPPPEDSTYGLTARDLVLALRVVANGADASEVLGNNLRWEALFSALLSLMLKKHLIADWEFIDELKKQL